MSVETELKTLITPLVAGGCYNTANLSTTVTVPYAVFYEISGIPEQTIHGYAGITSHRYQVDVFARSPEHAKALALGTIKSAIEGSAVLGGTLVFHMVGEYNPSDRTYQYITEYQIWAA